MTESIMYNQDVTADILNNIAVDLGATSFSKFRDGESYAVDELNEITSTLITKGIILTGDRCEVTYKEGMIYVATGVIVFDNGAKIKISAPKSFVAPGGTSYVYAVNDIVNNVAQLVCSGTAPDETVDYVMLAEVTDGVVTGLRNVCKMKVDSQNMNQNKDLDDFDFTVEKDESEQGYILKKIIDCEISCFAFLKFSYIIDTPFTNINPEGEMLIDLTSGESEVELRALDEKIKIIKDLNKIQIYSSWVEDNEVKRCTVYFSNVKVL